MVDEGPGHSLHRLGEVLGSEHIQEVVSVFGIANTLSGERGGDFFNTFFSREWPKRELPAPFRLLFRDVPK